MNDRQQQTDSPVPAQPSKAARLAAVFAFFVVLFVVADMVGLPLATEFVFSFFLMIAAPLALMGALLVVGLLAFVRRAGARGRLFDAGLQTFIMISLLTTGVFVVRMPGILRDAYPEWRGELVGYLSDDHSAEEKERFLESSDRLWFWFRDVLRGEENVPEPTRQDEARELILTFFSESLAPECPTCDPVLTREETRAFVQGVESVLPSGGQPVSSDPNVEEEAAPDAVQQEATVAPAD